MNSCYTPLSGKTYKQILARCAVHSNNVGRNPKLFVRAVIKIDSYHNSDADTMSYVARVRSAADA